MRLRIESLFVVVFLSIFSCYGLNYTPPLVTVKKISMAPALDGKIDAEEWRDAVRITGMIGMTGKLVNKPQPVVYLMYASNGIYIGFESPLRGNPIVGNQGIDQPVWTCDSFEIFLSPAKNPKEYYQFGVNAAGGTYDGKLLESGWNGVWTYKTQRTDSLWSGEIFIPFSTLNKKCPAEKEAWGFNVCRNFAGEGVIGSSLAKVGENSFKGYHQPEAFGTMVFDVNSAVVKVIGLGRLSAGEMSLEAEILDFTQPLVCAIDIDEKTPYSIKKPINSDSEGKIKIDRKMDCGGLSNSAVRIEVKKPDGGTLFSQIIPFNLMPLLKGSMASSPSASKLEVSADLSGVPSTIIVKEVQVEIRKSNETAIVDKKQIKRFSKSRGIAEFDLNKLDCGNFIITMKLISTDEKEIACISMDFNKPDQTWKGNTIGLSDQVPFPWSPLKITKNTVECWGRKFVLGNEIITQIFSQDAALLASPLKVIARMNGQKIEWQNSEPKIIKSGEAKSVFQVVSSSSEAQLIMKAEIEFDGFMKIEMQIKPLKNGDTLDSLLIELPMLKERAKYISTSAGTYQAYLQGYLPKDGLGSSFLPFIWLTDDKKGLCWMSESSSGWSLKNQERAIAVDPEDSATFLRINVVDKPIVLDKAYNLVFALQPTPVKPLAKDWRTRYRWLNTYMINRYGLYQQKPEKWEKTWQDNAQKKFCKNQDLMNMSVDWTFQKVNMVYFGMADSLQPEKTKAMVDFYHGKKIKILPYTGPDMVSTRLPEYQYYKKDWITGGDAGSGFPDEPVYLISPESPDWADFYTYKMYNSMKTLGFDGLYQDWAEATLSYTNEKGSKYPLFADREIHKRIYQMVKSFGNDKVVITHASGGVGPWVHSFSDLNIGGEEKPYCMGGKKTAGDPIDCYALDKFHVEYSTAALLGVPGGNLGYVNIGLDPTHFYKDNPKTCEANTEAFLSMLMLNDALISDLGTARDENVIRKYYLLQDSFGVNDSEFLGWWEMEGLVTLKAKTSKASIYLKNDLSAALLTVVNLDDNAVSENVNINPDKLTSSTSNLKIISAKEVFKNDQLDLNGNAFTLNIPRHSLRIIEIKLQK